MTFHEVFLAFVGLLVASSAVKAGACVCNVGEEPNSIKGEPSLKLLPDQNPCECTEFRPGGVNTKQQAKPNEVRFGNDGHPEGWTKMDCIHDTQTSSTSPPCATYFLKSKEGLGTPLFGEAFQSYPARLEFSLQSSNSDMVEIASFKTDNVFLCTFELDSISNQMRIKKGGSTIQTEDFQDAFDGSIHYLVTINQYTFEFGRLGETSALEFHSLNDKITRFTIGTQSGTTLVFYGTCPGAVWTYSSN